MTRQQAASARNGVTLAPDRLRTKRETPIASNSA
jgi:hypothetical protein